MAKKLLLTVTLFAVTALLTGCGGGSGNSSGPSGVNPNMPSIVQMLPVQYIAQTNSFITFKAKILNGNGNVMPGVGVVFTKLSLLGILSSTYAVTDSLGFATITVSSTTPGFATVQAEVNTGTGIVRDKRTVYFTGGDLNVQPFVVLDVDGDGDFVYNEPSDFELFESQNDNLVNIRATVYSGIGQSISGTTVMFGADAAYRTAPGGSCSDSSDSCEVTFLLGNTSTTNSFGQAFTTVQVSPVTLRNITTILNITAQDLSFGAYNIVSLFLNPVTVSSVTVLADPTTIAGTETSTINARALTTAGTVVPDGTAVSFTASGGGISPAFGQTTDGIAESTFTANPTDTGGIGSVTATVGGQHATVSITITPGT